MSTAKSSPGRQLGNDYAKCARTPPSHFQDFGKHVPDFEYHLVSLRDKSSEELLTIQDALGTLCSISNPMRAEELDEAAERLLRILASFTPEERVLVEMLARLHDEIVEVREKGRLAGILAGRMEGREEGFLAGREATAVKMLERGLTISLISETTGVSEERLRELAGGKE